MALAKGLRPVHVVSVILVVRLLSVFVVQTSFVPDEYWQSLEVAHEYVFGYGALTWEWQKGLRSYLYPSVIAALYTVLKYTGLDYPEAVIIVPRIFQALLSTYADYCFYKWTGGRKWALFLVLTSWFWFYTASRTILQTVETSLLAIGLSKFPFKAGKRGYYDQENNNWVWFACISTFIRPTSSPVWIVLAVYNLFTTNQGTWRLLFRTYLPIGLLTGGALVALDTYFYGSLIITPWEFFKFNVLHNISAFYGKHPWYWYMAVGIPSVLAINVVPLLISLYRVARRPRENTIHTLLVVAAAAHIAVHSVIEHKELRFVQPLIPIFLYLIQDLIVPWSRKAVKWQLYSVAGLLVITNALPAAYFGVLHQAGPLQTAPLLRDAISSNRTSLLYMMPCHSMPLYSHLHINVTTRYLNCDPPIDKPGVVNEQDAFYNNPEAWWRKEHATRQLPTLVVLFDVLRGRVEHLLRDYKLLHEVPHTQFPEGEMGEKILVYKKQPRIPVDPAI
ncbi:GPI mannosyltransferase 3 [Epargyreus clarus]|uniref:GPI mannosyltransferase 3 n=1 Tax=Epargyreus clarus TaxID=520877 RepID=UPI003C301A31